MGSFQTLTTASDEGMAFRNELANIEISELTKLLGFDTLFGKVPMDGPTLGLELGSLFVDSDLSLSGTHAEIVNVAKILAALTHVSYAEAYHELMAGIYRAKGHQQGNKKETTHTP